MTSAFNMKHHPHHSHRNRQAMTLIELLVVISIIGVLAGLLMPALAGAKKRAKIMASTKDMADLKGAVAVYQNDYSRLPASTPAATLGTDFTYGTTNQNNVVGTGSTGYGTNIWNGPATIPPYQACNAELMMILAGVTPTSGYVPDPSVANDQRNPRKTSYFHAKSSGANSGAGLGTDGVMRDPWGNPYIIALDLNYDGWVSNSVYRLDAVTTPSIGLAKQAGVNTWALKDSVMIFSFGPDGMFDMATKADVGVNRDNVLSWK